MSFGGSSERVRQVAVHVLAWGRPKMEQCAAAGPFSCSTCESFCASATHIHTHTQHGDTETKSQSCVQLVQNGKHVRSSALGAAASSYATLTSSTPAKNKSKQKKGKSKSLFFCFSAPFVLWKLDTGRAQNLGRMWDYPLLFFGCITFSILAFSKKSQLNQPQTFYHLNNKKKSDNMLLWMLSNGAAILLLFNACFLSGHWSFPHHNGIK